MKVQQCLNASGTCYRLVNPGHGQTRRSLSSWFSWFSKKDTQATPAEGTYTASDGSIIHDQFRWMETDKDRLHEYLLQQSHQFRSAMTNSNLSKLSILLSTEFELTRSNSLQSGSPPGEQLGNWIYTNKSGTPSQSSNVCLTRQSAGHVHGTASDEEHTVLDDRILATAVADASRMTGLQLVPSVVAIKLSHCQDMIAVLVPDIRLGMTSDLSAALLLDCRTGKLLNDGLIPAVSSVEWFSSGEALLVITPDATGRPCKLFLHTRPDHVADAAGSSSHNRRLQQPTTPILLYESTDPAQFLSLGRTKDWAYLLLNSNTKTSSQVHLIDAAWEQSTDDTSNNNVSAPSLNCIQPHTAGLEYFVEHYRGNLIMLTNHQPIAEQPSNDHAHALQQPTTGNTLQTPSATDTVCRVGCDSIMRTSSADCNGQDTETGNESVTYRNSSAVSSQLGDVPYQGNLSRQQYMMAELGMMQTLLQLDGKSMNIDTWSRIPGLQLPPAAIITDMDMFNGWFAMYGLMHAKPAVWVAQFADFQSNSSRAATTHNAGVNRHTPAKCKDGQHVMAIQHSNGTGDMCEDGAAVVSHCIQVALPEWATAVTPGLNADSNLQTLRLICSSPVHPPHTYEYHVITKELKLLHVAASGCGGCLGVDAWADNSSFGNNTSHIAANMQARTAPNTHSKGTENASSYITAQHTAQGAFIPNNNRTHDQQTDNEQGHNPDEYVVQRLWVTQVNSNPGLIVEQPSQFEMPSVWHNPPVPITLVCHTSLVLPSIKPGPLLMIAYGAYGQVLDTGWQPHIISLLRRGVKVAYVHVRGGGELGRSWHARGRGRHKHASIQDFKAVAHALTASGYVQPGMISVYGYSAGAIPAAGLLADEQAKQLICSAVLRLGFLDMFSAMQHTDLASTQHEIDEWGDPRHHEDAMAMRRACPYALLNDKFDNTGNRDSLGRRGSQAVSGPFPAVLASTAVLDSRVPCWIPAKWFARVQQLQVQAKGQNPLLLNVLWDRGHYADAADTDKDTAVEHAFMLAQWQRAAAASNQR